MSFYFLNPGSRGSDLLEIKLVSVDDAVKIHIAVVTLYNLCFGLQGTYNLAHLAEFFLCNFGSLVKKDNITKFYLLDDEVLNVIFVDVVTHKVATAIELVAHTQCIDNGNNAVKLRIAIHNVFRT